MNLKSLFTKIICLLYEKFSIVIFISVLILSLFIRPDVWTNWINVLWVNPIMSKALPYKIGLLCVSIFLLVIYYSYKFLYAEVVDKTRLVVLTLYTIIYVYCYLTGPWTYDLMIGDIPWTHCTLLPLFIEIILCIRIYYIRPDIEKNELFAETTKGIQDTYNRKEFVKTTYKNLRTCFFEEGSFSLAITGSWGSGKSTFLNYLKQEIVENKIKVSIIDFEPWKNDSPKSIMKTFFSILSRELDKHIPLISISIDKYVSLLINESPKDFKLIIQTLQTFFKTLNSQSPFKKIYTSLKKSRHKVIIFIDDIDRLNAEEIIEVLSLIRNTANFPYLQFIVAFDKDYVIKSLKNKGIYNPIAFIEKFFNIEINLPSVQDTTICSDLEKLMVPIISDIWNINRSDNDIMNLITTRTESPHNSYVNYFLITNIIRNQRDVLRFTNSFKLISSIYRDKNLVNEISYKDLFYLELLRYKFYEVYMILYCQHLSILLVNTENEISFYQLRSDSSQFLFPSTYTDYDKEVCMALLENIFKGTIPYTSLRYVRNYGRYFMVHLDEKILTKHEFMSLIDLEGRDLITNAINVYKHKYASEFEHTIGSILSDISHEYNFYPRMYSILSLLCLQNESKSLKEEVSKAVVDHANSVICENSNHLGILLQLLSKVDLGSYPIIKRFDTLKFLTTLLFKENLKRKIQSGLDGTESNLIKQFLITTACPITISNSLFTFVNSNSKDHQDQLVCSIDDIKFCLVEIFRCCTSKFSEEGKQLLNNCKEYVGGTDEIRLIYDAKIIMKQAIEENPEIYLSNFVNKGQSASDDCNTVYPDPNFLLYFDSIDSFESFLSEHKDNPNLEKTLNFWELYKYHGYRPILFQDQGSVSEKVRNNFRDEIVLLEDLLQIKREVEQNETVDAELQKRLEDNALYIKLHGDISKMIEYKISLYKSKTQKNDNIE